MIVIDKPDLSFTEDPKWIAEREVLWDQYCENQYSELRKEKLRVRKVYFFTGVFERPQDNGRGQSIFLKARVNDFPLRRAEGWDYVVYMLGGFSNVEMTKLLVHQILGSLISLGWSLEEELALWDHFLPETYESIVRTPGPAKKHGLPLEGVLPIDSVIRQYLVNLKGLLSGYSDVSSKYLYRSKLLLSALQSVDDIYLSQENSLNSLIKSLFSVLYMNSDNISDEYKIAFRKFTKNLAGSIESTEFHAGVLNIWEEVKKENDG
ncbi:MAG: hypothetical protein ABJ000_10325 [Saccharospirillum sp.]|uniref:hypothetical protein n=1 Tax=Saccharospirillum sp. TaxID=2033801 RepID=UPI003296CE00